MRRLGRAILGGFLAVGLPLGVSSSRASDSAGATSVEVVATIRPVKIFLGEAPHAEEVAAGQLLREGLLRVRPGASVEILEVAPPSWLPGTDPTTKESEVPTWGAGEPPAEAALVLENGPLPLIVVLGAAADLWRPSELAAGWSDRRGFPASGFWMVPLGPMIAASETSDDETALEDFPPSKQPPRTAEMTDLPVGWAAAGATPLGTFFAVARHLELAYGVRWFTPGEIGSEYPLAAEWVGVERPSITRPSFLERTILAGRRAGEPSAWGRRNRLESLFDFNHGIHRLVTPQVQAEHPQWVSVVAGQPRPIAGGRGPQPHFAAAGLADWVADAVRQRLEVQPPPRSISLSATDTYYFDQGADTAAVVRPFRYFAGRPDYAPLLFGFANRVAEQLFPWDAREGPVLGMLAYLWTERAPDFPIHPNVMPWVTADRHQWFDPALRDAELKNLQRWLGSGARLVGTWDYYEGLPYLVPRHTPTLLAESLQWLHRAGVDGFFAEGEPRWGWDGPRYWLAAQLLWDAEQSPEKLLQSYFDDYYRESAAPMRAYFAALEAQWMAQPGPGAWLKYYDSPHQLALFPPDFCEATGLLLQQAEALARTPKVWQRIRETARLHAQLTALSRLFSAWSAAAAQPRPSPEALASLADERLHLRSALIPPTTPRLREQSITEREPLAHDPALLSSVIVTWLMSPQFQHRLEALETAPNLDCAAPEIGGNVAEQRPSWKVLERLTWEDPWFSGDEAGLLAEDAWSFVDARTGPGQRWEVDAQHTEAMHWQRAPEAARTGSFGLRLSGQYHASLRTRWDVEPGQRYAWAGWVRGRVSGDGRVAIRLLWRNAEGRRIGQPELDCLPLGQHGWIRLTALGTAPPHATSVSLQFSLQNQYPGDEVHLDDFAFFTEAP